MAVCFSMNPDGSARLGFTGPAGLGRLTGWLWNQQGAGRSPPDLHLMLLSSAFWYLSLHLVISGAFSNVFVVVGGGGVCSNVFSLP